ncbi:hypothetical protein AB1Y20_022020 [Prymnesium parvum]|uniref:DNA-directed RNA polymerase RBP11-like dimerisation domain-containing protein n=1 Tax=Prymnesium parvum TaxID=97485 RepID=A0AB34JHL0_PRYPA
MNKPDDFECWRLPDDDSVPKVSMIKDQKVANAVALVIEREDHTLGNMLRMQLLEDDEVIFSGYRVPHPLEPAIQLKVQTRSEQVTPVQAVQAGVQALIGELDVLRDRFDSSLAQKRREFAAPPRGFP